jgi:hypothetical protein
LYFKKCKNCSLLFTFTVIFFLKIWNLFWVPEEFCSRIWSR